MSKYLILRVTKQSLDNKAGINALVMFMLLVH